MSIQSCRGGLKTSTSSVSSSASARCGTFDGIVEKAKAAGQQPFGIEGYDGGRWILIDLSDVVVHVFVPEERELYGLERLWGDAPVVLRIA